MIYLVKINMKRI